MKKFWNWLIVSSADPDQASLTVTSFLKSLLAIVLLVAQLKGLDTALVGAQYGVFVTQAGVFVAAGLAVFHSAEMLYGAGRKLYLTAVGKPVDATA